MSSTDRNRARRITPGGLNFDCKVRRESTDLKDMFISHIGKYKHINEQECDTFSVCKNEKITRVIMKYAQLST